MVATDLDDGDNGRVIYSFGTSDSDHASKLFEINSETGDISLKVYLPVHTYRM